MLVRVERRSASYEPTAILAHNRLKALDHRFQTSGCPNEFSGHGPRALDKTRIVDGEMSSIFIKHLACDHHRLDRTSVFPINDLIGCVAEGDKWTRAEIKENKVGLGAAVDDSDI